MCSKHEYIIESMETKDTETESDDESFDFHLDPNRVRADAEIQLFADVFSISFDDAVRILVKAGRRCESIPDNSARRNASISLEQKQIEV